MRRASSFEQQQVGNRRDRGVAAVELAIILPLFGILLLGIIEIGALARDHQVLQNGAREGARFSSLPANRVAGVANGPQIETMIKDRIIAYLANEGITVVAGNITINQAYEMTYAGSTIPASEITIEYARPVLFPGIANWFALNTTLRGKAIFRNFYA
ncbi:MAG TPA: TadE family protein [Terriglobia bacterium]|nr:TadE family protein [Terriglobia bacterium]